MKNVLRLFLVPLVTLTFAGFSFAQATPATPAKPTTPAKQVAKKEGKTKVHRAVGELTSVDAKAGTLAVRVNGKEMSFTADTQGARAALEKVKVGDKVRVSYTETNGKLLALSVSEAKAKTVAKVKTGAAKGEAKALEKKSETKEQPKAEKK